MWSYRSARPRTGWSGPSTSTAAFTGGELRFSPGLLAAADGGVLYVDEINLLPDHLVDVLLDAAASGVNRVEREGISHAHPSRFLLIGSMNPEEGDLRPQLLDRFGLAVEVRAGDDPSERAAAVRRRLAFDEDPAPVVGAVAAEEATLARRLSEAAPASLPDGLVEAVSALCVSVGAEGLRADLTICRAAAALAGWEGRVEAEPRRRAPGGAAGPRPPFPPRSPRTGRHGPAATRRMLWTSISVPRIAPAPAPTATGGTEATEARGLPVNDLPYLPDPGPPAPADAGAIPPADSDHPRRRVEGSRTVKVVGAGWWATAPLTARWARWRRLPWGRRCVGPPPA